MERIQNKVNYFEINSLEPTFPPPIPLENEHEQEDHKIPHNEEEFRSKTVKKIRRPEDLEMRKYFDSD